jgi:uncharacterized protein (DUF2252 family)
MAEQVPVRQTAGPPTVQERAALGRAARATVGRRSHGEWAPSPRREDPLDVLERQARERVQELVPLRYERMAASPFAFLRGSAAVMAADLARTPISGLRAQLCGDAHLANFGAFAAPDRQLVFDVNDFDETLPGPWEWDVKRLAASIAVAGRDRGFDLRERSAATEAAVREYREALRSFAGAGHFDVWYARLDSEAVVARWRDRVSPAQRRSFERNVAKARTRTSLRALERLTERVDGTLRISADPPLVVPIEDQLDDASGPAVEAGVEGLFDAYRTSVAGATAHLLGRYRYVHAARKVVGVGSVGTRAWIALLLGDDEDDPLFLQFKQAEASVLEPHVGASEYAQHGQRVVEGQWLMQAASDICLGWVSVTGIDGRPRDFYVRQLWDWKRSADIDQLVPAALAAYGQMCGWTLARAHARSGDAVAIAAYLGGGDAFDRALGRFAEAYADQNERDHAALVAARAPGGRLDPAALPIPA